MSRVLARPMFKKKAPKRSAKGVGITSMLEDDVPGYAEGGEVNDDRTERERMAQMLLEQGREEYQRFSEGERPQMTRLPATMGMMPQPNPQQVQAAQMQQMAQMGMLPRFQEGGIVQRQPLYGWGSRIRGWSEPDPRTGTPGMDNPEFRYREPAMPIEGQTYMDPMGGYTGGDLPIPPTPDQGLNIPVPDPVRAALGLPVFAEPEEKPYTPSAEGGSPAGDTGGIMGGRVRREEPKPKKEAPPLPRGERKASDLTEIKQERAAREASAREENKWLAIMQAGLAIAGGRSPNAITNIGQGGQAGLASFMALEQQRRRDEDAAMRRAIAEREVNLQERRLAMQEPYIQAQTEYMRARPAIAAAQIQARQQAVLARAQMKAVEDIDAQEAKNPMLFMGANGKPDPMKKQIALQRRTQQLAAQYSAIYGGGGFSQDPLGLGLGGSADEE